MYPSHLPISSKTRMSSRLLRLPLVAAILFALLSHPAIAAVLKHRFVAVDNGANKLVLVDEFGGKGWSVSIPSGSRDLQRIGGGKILVSHGNGAAEYDVAMGQKGWSLTGYSGVNSAWRLSNGNTLIGVQAGNDVVIHEVDKDKKEVKKTMAAGWKDLRLLRRLDNGNTLFTVSGPYRVVEVDRDGKMVWKANITGKGYLATRLANGNTRATTGETVTAIDLDKDGKIVATLGGKDKHPTARLLWFSGFETLPNGNVLVANWCGHGQEGKGPHAVEFDSQNKLVWQWEDHKAAKTVTNVLTVEEEATSVHPIRPERMRLATSLRATGIMGEMPAFNLLGKIVRASIHLPPICLVGVQDVEPLRGMLPGE